MPRKTSETKLCAELVKTARLVMPWAVTFNHCDRATGGIPDVSFTGRRTFWAELKYADPDFDSPEVQEITMQRLYRACHLAFYVVYTSQLSVKIMTPREFLKWPHGSTEVSCVANNSASLHRDVLNYVAARIR